MFVETLPALEQQQYAHHKEKIHGEERQQDLNNNRCTDLSHRETTPAQQADPYHATAHTGNG